MSDLHTRNLTFTISSIDSLREEDFFRKLGKPKTGFLRRKDGNPLEPGVPEYLSDPLPTRQIFRCLPI